MSGITYLIDVLGFDRTVYRPFRGYRIGCSQCEPLVINGYPTHETGCPNGADARREQQDEHPEYDNAA